jgi:signal transduction histidine kinase
MTMTHCRVWTPPCGLKRFILASRILGLVLVLLACRVALAAQPYLLSGEHASLAGEIEILRDAANTLTIEHVAQPSTAAPFEQLQGEPNLGFLQGTVWLRFTLTRPAHAPRLRWLELKSGLIDHVVLYVPAAGDGWTRHVSGDMQPWSGRDLQYHNPVFRLDLPAEQPVTFYLQLRSMSTLSFSLDVWTNAAFLAASNQKMLVFGLLIGMHLFLILSNIWLFRATRGGSSGLMALYTLNNGLAILSAEGFFYQHLLQDWPQLNGTLQLVTSLLAFPIASTFFMHFMDLLKPPRAYWVAGALFSLWAMALGAIFLALVAEPPWLRQSYSGWLFFCGMLLYLTTVRLAWHGNRPAQQLVWVGTLLWVGVLFRLARNNGLLAPNMFTDQFHWVSSVIFLLAINYSLTRRYQGLHQEKQQAQAQALKNLRSTEQRLQIEVDMRTQALQEALAQVNTSLSVERQAREDQRRFFSTVSHELRTPLAVIDATAKNLELDGQSLDDPTRRRYEKIQRATQQLVELVKRCFREDRFELLDRGPQCQPTDLNELLFDARESVLLLDQQHLVRIDTSDLPETFPCDPELTQLALSTLIGNAIKYTPPGTLITLRGYTSGQGVTLEVVDNGPGVSEDDLPHLFGRYYRGKNANFVPGTGLGLPLARELIQMQGGSLTIGSMPGQGFCARVCLPGVQVELPASA